MTFCTPVHDFILKKYKLTINTIKYILYYNDRFEQVLLLPGHRGSVWGLDISGDGSQLYSSGQDRSIRTWERGEDLVFVEEERERALEAKVLHTVLYNILCALICAPEYCSYLRLNP